jgi:hypothetical protein
VSEIIALGLIMGSFESHLNVRDPILTRMNEIMAEFNQNTVQIGRIHEHNEEFVLLSQRQVLLAFEFNRCLAEQMVRGCWRSIRARS